MAAPPPDRDDPQSHQQADEENPFITFRRFADAKFSSLLQNLLGLPSALSSTLQWQQLEDERARKGKEMRSWGGAVSADEWHERLQQEESPKRYLQEDRKHSNHQLGAQSPTSPQSPVLLAVLSRVRDIDNVFPRSCPSRSPHYSVGWLPGYLLYSSYSPLLLEQNTSSLKWRDAFEDLILSEKGHEMVDRAYSEATRDGKHWADWLEDIFRLEVSTTYEHGSKVLNNEDGDACARTYDDTAPRTEMDMYEHFFGQKPLPPSSMKPQTENPTESHQERVRFSDIVATITTTQRTVASDGSVNTKIVFKKRFADGREESSETVQTTQKPSPAIEALDEAKSLRGPSSQMDRPKGWFWK